jgi:hypothetical protein
MQAFSFSPAEIAQEIARIVPDFTVTYKIDPSDVRQVIAESVPKSMC